MVIGVRVVKHFEWISSMLLDAFRIPRATSQLHLDNEAICAVCTKLTGATKRLRHVLLHIHYILQRTKSNDIVCVKTPSADMIVDDLTKATSPSTLWSHLPRLLGDSEAMRIKHAQAMRIIAKLEPQPYFQLPSDEAATAVVSPDKYALSDSSPAGGGGSSSPSAVRPLVSVSSVSSSGGLSVESLLAAGIGAAVSAVLTHVSLASSADSSKRARPSSPASTTPISRRPRRGSRVCFQFNNTGRCSKGDQCSFPHVNPKK